MGVCVPAWAEARGTYAARAAIRTGIIMRVCGWVGGKRRVIKANAAQREGVPGTSIRELQEGCLRKRKKKRTKKETAVGIHVPPPGCFYIAPASPPRGRWYADSNETASSRSSPLGRRFRCGRAPSATPGAVVVRRPRPRAHALTRSGPGKIAALRPANPKEAILRATQVSRGRRLRRCTGIYRSGLGPNISDRAPGADGVLRMRQYPRE